MNLTILADDENALHHESWQIKIFAEHIAL